MLVGTGAIVFMTEMLSARKIFRWAWPTLGVLFVAVSIIRWINGDFLAAGLLTALPITMLLSGLVNEKNELKLFNLLMFIITGLAAALVELGIGWSTQQWLDVLLPRWLPQHEVFLISCTVVGGVSIVLLLSQTGFTAAKKLLLAGVSVVLVFFTLVTVYALRLEQATILLLLLLWLMILNSRWSFTHLSAAIQVQFSRFFTLMAGVLALAAVFSLLVNWYGSRITTANRDTHLGFVQNSLSQFLEDSRRSILLANQFDKLSTLLVSPRTAANLAEIQLVEKSVYLSSTRFRTVFVISADGRVFDTYPGFTTLTGLDLSDRDYFKRLVKGESLVMSNTLPARLNPLQLSAVTLNYAVRSESGELVGVLTGSLDLEQMAAETVVSETSRSFEGYLLLADSTGTVFADSRPDVKDSLLTTLSLEDEGSLAQPKNYVDEAGSLRQRVVVPHETSSWSLILDYPIEQLFAHYARWSYIGFMWIFFSGFLFVLVLIRRDKPGLAVSVGSGKNL